MMITRPWISERLASWNPIGYWQSDLDMIKHNAKYLHQISLDIGKDGREDKEMRRDH